MCVHIAIIGYGTEGKEAVAYFQKHGHAITIRDVNEHLDEGRDGNGVQWELGPHYLNNLNKFDAVFRSPGVPFLKGEFNSIRDKLTSPTKYFFEKCPCRIIGITGTKGKGTTSALTYEILKTHHAKNTKTRVFLGGNIGTSPLSFLDQLKKEDIVVLELSSFQLQDLGESPHIAVVLGITPDHMDYHRDMREYIEAKKNIVKHQNAEDFAVIDVDNKESADFGNETKAAIYEVSTTRPVEEGAFLQLDKFIFKKGKTAMVFGEKKRIQLVGRHNIKNIFAAATVAGIMNIPVETITEVIRDFKGLPHRLEFVGIINDARFYNDSASTNPDTAIAAINTFDEPLILIAGGSDKNTDFSSLGEAIARRANIKTVMLMGETKDKIEKAIEAAVKIQMTTPAQKIGRRRDAPLELISAESYQEAFMAAKILAQPGDIVLLSPACASFDMFTNYAERGDIFRDFVLESGN